LHDYSMYGASTYKLATLILEDYPVRYIYAGSVKILNPLLLPTDAHNVKKRRVIKTF